MRPVRRKEGISTGLTFKILSSGKKRQQTFRLKKSKETWK